MTARAAADVPIGDFVRLVERTAGITVPDADMRNLENVIVALSAARGMRPAGYLAALSRDGREVERFLDRITNNETYFFREERHFTALKDEVFPRLATHGGPIVIWSATCSTGEEAWSLCALARECLGDAFRVVGTDINHDSLRVAETGSYSKNSFRADGAAYRGLIEGNTGRADGRWVVSDELRRRVEWRRCNLYADPAERMPEGAHVVFFRNTLIYMRQEIKQAVVEKIARRMAPGGHLFLASSEMPLIVNPGLALAEYRNTYYFVRAVAAERPRASQDQSVVAPIVRDAAEERPAARVMRAPEAAVLSAAESLHRDPFFRLSERDPAHLAAGLMHYALFFVNRMNIAAAAEAVRLAELFTGGAVVLHLKGFVAMAGGDAAGAAGFFRGALAADGGFWPSRFYLASLLRVSDGVRAAEEFRRCRRDIAAAAGSGDARFRFLLEGFSEKYFMEICDNWIATGGKPRRGVAKLWR